MAAKWNMRIYWFRIGIGSIGMYDKILRPVFLTAREMSSFCIRSLMTCKDVSE